MSDFARAPLTAILGPTNTGKTHLAVERMCGHSSGMIGFPLRLLAREVYDRVAKLKGAHQVALITGEERIVPPQARWFLTTAESMPLRRTVGGSGEDPAFVGIDEAQLGTDPERGHVFTDRILHARGREETMILGSQSLAPMVRKLLPEAAIIGRPRFSTLAHRGAAKFSRLPPRSAIVAFSAEEVYAVAELLRRTRGGAAVVMGPLSPRTRNAQVAMFEAGEVDFLVATDAIGMGLNMDVHHVAFAGLSKFDGRRRRRLTPAEMAQIAGRAGRHQRDGSFGTLAGAGGTEFRPEEIEAIEAHRFSPIEHLYWRENEPDFASPAELIESLQARPTEAVLRAAPEAVDLAVLKRLAEDPAIAARAADPASVRRLWAACGLPDFRKTGAEHHAQLVSRLFAWLAEGEGHIPRAFFADQLARLDSVQGDIDVLADRIASVRTWAYIAFRPDWLADPEEMAERAMAIEEKLSDALHERLTQRFVDQRSTMLIRGLGGRDGTEHPVTVGEEGEVLVGPHPIGRLEGFAFQVDPLARSADRKRLLATAERRLASEIADRASALAGDGDEAFALDIAPGVAPGLLWRGHKVARLAAGANLLSPRIRLDKRLSGLSAASRAAVDQRLVAWVAKRIAGILGPLRAAGSAARDPGTPSALRSILAMLVDRGGLVERRLVDAALTGLDRPARQRLKMLGIRIAALDLYLPAMLKPEARRWRAALAAASTGFVAALPDDGATVLPLAAGAERAALERLGFRALGPQMLRVDLVDRLAAFALRARAAGTGEPVDRALATSLGLAEAGIAGLMEVIGFRPCGASPGVWRWHGPRRTRARPRESTNPAFAALAGLGRG